MNVFLQSLHMRIVAFGVLQTCCCLRSNRVRILEFALWFDTSNYHLVELHFLIHCNKPITDSTSSWPFIVNLYSTLGGGVSLYDCLSSMPPLCSSFSLGAKVLLLNPFNVCLNLIYLTEFVVQHRGIKISSVPFLVISFHKSKHKFRYS